MQKIFITGGTGYIGSHTCVEPLFIQGDIRDEELMYQSMMGCSSVIHLAGLKACR